MSIRILHNSRDEVRPEWAALIAPELDMVERRLESAVSSEVAAASELSLHLLSAGGKRIRPALVILSALASSDEVNNDKLINLAAAMELVHTASLVHDDVLDETRERRGVKTANSEWGNKLSVLGGDFLLATAFSLLAGSGSLEVIRLLSNTAIRMTESEMLQLISEGNISAWEESYWRIIQDKTAGFMGSCCECGAVLSCADPAICGALANYGVQLGLAFQITDDVLDVAGDSALTGKDVGTDLMSGKFTLPVLLALKNLSESSRCELLDELNNGVLTRERARAVAAKVVDCGAAELARRAASDYAAKAQEYLRAIPQSRYRSALESLTVFVTTREA